MLIWRINQFPCFLNKNGVIHLCVGFLGHLFDCVYFSNAVVNQLAMTGFSYQEQERALKAFFRQKEKDLTAATLSAYKVAGQKLAGEIKKELRKNFKKGVNSAGFFQAVSVKPGLSARGNPYCRVALKIAFMGIYQTGGIVAGNPWLIILTTEGARLGFKRITKSNSWAKVWGAISSHAKIVKVSDGLVVVYFQGGKSVPIYKFQKEVRLGKRLTVLETGEQIYDSLPDEIERLLT